MTTDTTERLTLDWYDALIIGEYHRTQRSGPQCASVSTVKLRFSRDTGLDILALAPVQIYLFRNGIINWNV